MDYGVDCVVPSNSTGVPNDGGRDVSDEEGSVKKKYSDIEKAVVYLKCVQRVVSSVA